MMTAVQDRPDVDLQAGVAFVAPPGPGRVVQYWASCSQMELFSLMGQLWFSGFCVVALALGWWKLPVFLGISVSLVLLSHLNSSLGLFLLGWKLTEAPSPSISATEALQRAISRRLFALRFSRGLLKLAALAFLPSLVQIAMTGVTWQIVTVCCTILFPWFSLTPRWRLEEPLLQHAMGE